MGTVPVFPHREPLTRTDLESIDDDGRRYELVDGVLLMSPSPRPLHQRVVARVLTAVSRECPREWEALPAPVDVVLTDNTVLIPDVLVGRRGDFTERALVGVPVLSVEVISPSSRMIDTQLKRATLEKAGCPYYWIIDPYEPSLLCLSLHDGEYRTVAEVRGDQTARLTEPFPVTITPEDLVVDYLD
ncbi:Uma2 family endonuclease [Herbihabitans rhizosphaerae]|uniref:Uma2 family endonuclease n=1 Tax=Herbihabitans rhizosphaerae TaxID=1872711 RepID=A0A4Q7L3K2_9PSEU|nr:Uma2 family endonuclease [Herbihabitans rhizosphaerae]RZS43817.1 Uma2 family endonuclease [Herbihabitans rhizosphaerae]